VLDVGWRVVVVDDDVVDVDELDEVELELLVDGPVTATIVEPSSSSTKTPTATATIARTPPTIVHRRRLLMLTPQPCSDYSAVASPCPARAGPWTAATLF
jgi:hypothetical protein